MLVVTIDSIPLLLQVGDNWSLIFNPRRACAARVIVARVIVLRLSVCVSVCLLQLAWLTWGLNL